MDNKGFLVLEDKTIFKGKWFGYAKQASGEVVFNTGMTGYPETLTDPSYRGQILVFTYPLIGNYGVPAKKYYQGIIKNFESERIHARGVIITCQSKSLSHWSAESSFNHWLYKNKIPGLCDVDTRFLTQKIRKKGTMLGKISKTSKIEQKMADPNKNNLVSKVSCQKITIYKGGPKKVLLIDCGVKAGIIRSLLFYGLTVIQVPWNYNPFINKLKFDAVVISNGPGNPKKVANTINNVKELLNYKTPILGICLGNQILALAIGADTYKLKYGHRSQNQPCLLLGSQKAYITSQNHGYAVKNSSLPRGWQEWFANLNDATNEGIIHKTKPFCSIQFHPEVSPGPTDTKFIFEKFISWIK